MTDRSLKDLENLDRYEGLLNWRAEFKVHDIRYEPHPAIKGQMLDDFIAECTIYDVKPQEVDPSIIETIYGPSNELDSGSRVVLTFIAKHK